MSSILNKAMSRMTNSAEKRAEPGADEPRIEHVLIAELLPRQVATVQGTLRSVTLRPVDGVSWLEAELADQSGSLSLIWLGRRRIEGISCGRAITVHGRVGERDGTLAIFNPGYELGA